MRGRELLQEERKAEEKEPLETRDCPICSLNCARKYGRQCSRLME